MFLKEKLIIYIYFHQMFLKNILKNFIITQT